MIGSSRGPGTTSKSTSRGRRVWRSAPRRGISPRASCGATTITAGSSTLVS
jgi:hypothetical protein